MSVVRLKSGRAIIIMVEGDHRKEREDGESNMPLYQKGINKETKWNNRRVKWVPLRA